MHQIHIKELPTLCMPLAGGYFGGLFRIDGTLYATIVAGKEGELSGAWNESTDAVADAGSYSDGRANTDSMAAAGSELAIAARSLRIAGLNDWYLPAQDELEISYRAMKPTTRENYCYARSGINLSSFEPTHPYTPEFPAQTQVEIFHAGGAEAFEAGWYWSSTQNAANPDYAWMQYFNNGNQYNYRKSGEYRARAVRRLLVIQ